MYARKCQFAIGSDVALHGWERTLHFSCFDVGPSHQFISIIEKQIALGVALTHQKNGICLGGISVVECMQIEIVEYIDIVDKEWFSIHSTALLEVSQ